MSKILICAYKETGESLKRALINLYGFSEDDVEVAPITMNSNDFEFLDIDDKSKNFLYWGLYDYVILQDYFLIDGQLIPYGYILPYYEYYQMGKFENYRRRIVLVTDNGYIKRLINIGEKGSEKGDDKIVKDILDNNDTICVLDILKDCWVSDLKEYLGKYIKGESLSKYVSEERSSFISKLQLWFKKFIGRANQMCEFVLNHFLRK